MDSRALTQLELSNSQFFKIHLCHTFFPVAPNLDAVAVATFRLRVTLSFLLPFAKQYCQECTRTFVMGILSSLKHCTHIYFSESSEFRRAAALPHSCDDGLKTLCLPSSHYYLLTYLCRSRKQ